AKANINIKALSIVDVHDWGIVKLIVDNPEKTKKIFHKLGLTYGEGQVVTVMLENHPGALADLADKLEKKKINIEQAFATASGDASFVVLSTTDDKKANSVIG
ncbi:MAG: amino acid-binding protein, partial [Bacteroidetes bacterium]|nr:amino acid-binding protein [Bacteroidota bacterium]